MPEPLAPQTRSDANLVEDVDAALLEDTRPHALLNVVAAAVLDHHRLDALEMEQMRQQQPGRTSADDPDLGAQLSHPTSGTSARTLLDLRKHLLGKMECVVR